ncbi:MAG TPA: RsmE family RNA methyltransferase [Candidatus Limnocylindria bacterium]|nr:RsmE family RNA methyltransferase [Candidatus Limnocylindria bacterium]
MTVHRFFVDAAEAVGDRFPVPPSIEHQVRRVLRLRDGDRLLLLTGDGLVAHCRLEDGVCKVERRVPAGGEPAHRLTIVQALLKGDALDEVVQQGTEMGVAAFRLVVTERCVVRELSPRRMERLRTIARESAEQSERAVVPAVDGPVPLAAVLRRGAVLLAERHDGRRLGDLPPPGSVIVGPEGGFGDAELRAAQDVGVALASLGPRILRSRTVAVTVAAAVLSRTGDFA